MWIRCTTGWILLTVLNEVLSLNAQECEVTADFLGFRPPQ